MQTYIRPKSLPEFFTAWSQEPELKLLAGGTDLLVNFRRGLIKAKGFLDISGLSELKALQIGDKEIKIGAGVSLAEVASNAFIKENFPAVAEAALSIAGPTHREVGTIGGNLCLDTRCVYYNQSEWWRGANNFCMKHEGEKCHAVGKSDRCYAVFSGDLAPALLVMGAEVGLLSAKGERRISLAEFYHDEGRQWLKLEAGEILGTIYLPMNKDLRSGYLKTRVRNSIEFPLAGVAVALAKEQNKLTHLRIAITGTNSRPLLIGGLDCLIGEPLNEEGLKTIADKINKAIMPVWTTVTTPKYRKKVAVNTAKRLTERLYRSISD